MEEAPKNEVQPKFEDISRKAKEVWTKVEEINQKIGQSRSVKEIDMLQKEYDGLREEAYKLSNLLFDIAKSELPKE